MHWTAENRKGLLNPRQEHDCLNNVSPPALPQQIYSLAPLFTAAAPSPCDQNTCNDMRWCINLTKSCRIWCATISIYCRVRLLEITEKNIERLPDVHDASQRWNQVGILKLLISGPGFIIFKFRMYVPLVSRHKPCQALVSNLLQCLAKYFFLFFFFFKSTVSEEPQRYPRVCVLYKHKVLKSPLA